LLAESATRTALIVVVSPTVAKRENDMATINGVDIYAGPTRIASAATGEIAPPPAANLTITNANWYVPDGRHYLQQMCRVTATAAGQPWGGTYRLTGIILPGTIKFTA
jgi:hypothetical protein